MTARQKAFAEYYAASGNATQSALKAGYSETYAKTRTHLLLKNVEICRYIKELTSNIQDKRIADMQEVQQMWTSILRDAEEKTADRLKASEYIAKVNGAFLDKVEVKADVQTNAVQKLTTEELKKLIKL